MAGLTQRSALGSGAASRIKLPQTSRRSARTPSPLARIPRKTAPSVHCVINHTPNGNGKDKFDAGSANKVSALQPPSPQKVTKPQTPRHSSPSASMRRQAAPSHHSAAASVSSRSSSPATIERMMASKPPTKTPNNNVSSRPESFQEQEKVLAAAIAQRKLLEKQQEKEEERVREEANGPWKGLVGDGKVYCERFVIRWYEVGSSRSNASVETIANLLQESSTGHSAAVGFVGDGFAATPEMRRRRLIWIIAKMHIEMDQWPKWGDVVETETWQQMESSVTSRREWILRLPHSNNKVIGRAKCCLMMMNQDTRRVSRIPQSIQDEIVPLTPSPARHAIDPADVPKVPKMEIGSGMSGNGAGEGVLEDSEGAEPVHFRGNLSARRSDLDLNQHVNNVTYLSWMLEAIPQHILEDSELAQITVEYRRECHRGEVVQSLVQATTPESPALEDIAAGKPERKEPELVEAGYLPHFLKGMVPEDMLALQTGMLMGEEEEEAEVVSYAHLLRLQDAETNSDQWKEIIKGQTVWRMVGKQ